MRLPVDKPPLPEVVERFLVEAGCSESARSKCTLDTRLYHDLGVYGDEANDYMQTLSERFGVDLGIARLSWRYPGDRQHGGLGFKLCV